MKIAFFHELTPLSGARKVIDEYARILGKKHEVDLYYVDDTQDESVRKIFSKVYYFKQKSSRNRLYRDSLELLNLYILHKRIAKLINDNKYDLVFVSPSRYTQAPFILRFIMDSVYFCQEPLRLVYDPILAIPSDLNLVKKTYEVLNRRIRKLIDAGNIRCAKLVLANSEFSRKTIYRAYSINAKVCYLGVDTQKFYPKAVKKIYDLLFIGDKTPIEGYDLLIQTLKTFKKPPSIKYISRNERGEGITEEALTNEINKAKIVLSLSKDEPFGLAPVEAMSCGVPVIAVSEGGLRESVTDGVTGYLIDRNVAELKRKIELLLGDEGLRKKLGKNARVNVLTKFSWEESVERFKKIIKEAGYKIT